jgi:hypothetical protein
MPYPFFLGVLDQDQAHPQQQLSMLHRINYYSSSVTTTLHTLLYFWSPLATSIRPASLCVIIQSVSGVSLTQCTHLTHTTWLIPLWFAQQLPSILNSATTSVTLQAWMCHVKHPGIDPGYRGKGAPVQCCCGWHNGYIEVRSEAACPRVRKDGPKALWMRMDGG